ncbi:MAG: hypothetical protein OXU70_08940 [Gammaproteobacteria bacterium]|nr:hypothetical protein [Gammaproteobacteria bacterium]
MEVFELAGSGVLGVLLGVILGWGLGRKERIRQRKIEALADGYGAGAFLSVEAEKRASVDERLKARGVLMRFRILFHDNADVQNNLRHILTTGKAGQYLPEAYKAAAKEVGIDPSIIDGTVFGIRST